MSAVTVHEVYKTGQDLSLLSLFSQATLFVKCILFILILMSIYSWYIIFSKSVVIKYLKIRYEDFQKTFWSATTLDDVVKKYEHSKNSFAKLFIACFWEFKRSNLGSSTDTKRFALEKIERIGRLTIASEQEKLEKGLQFLGTVASVTPFIGLLGTVWGIIDSFRMIGLTQNTSLAAVAPGIAEALFATALSLIVTIPAVIAYNKLSKSIEFYCFRMESFVDELLTIFTKKIE